MPYAEPVSGTAWRAAPRLSTLEGRTVGIVNNSWRCMHVIAENLATLLTRDLGVAAVREVRISAAQTLPEERFAELAAECDAVVVGIGN